MRLTFHLRQPFQKAIALAEAVRAGAERFGDSVEIEQGFEHPRPGGLVMLGIGGESRSIFDAYREAGAPVVFWDKGYSRRGYRRVAVGDFQPNGYFQREPRPADRWEGLGIKLASYAGGGDAILFDGASNKYCLWQGLGDWLEWGQAMIDRIAANTDRPIIYRPRPSHNGAVALRGAELSTRPLEEDFARSAIVVSHGGNIGFDAICASVPHFAIGDSIARPLSETDWSRVGDPRIPSHDRRRQWCHDLAYCQWTLDEIESGEAWADIRGHLIREEGDGLRGGLQQAPREREEVSGLLDLPIHAADLGADRAAPA